MNELTLANRAANWPRLKTLVLDGVSSPITKRVYNQSPGPDSPRPRWAPGRVALKARRSGAVSINVRITTGAEARIQPGRIGP
jgi:hypothetical protein